MNKKAQLSFQGLTNTFNGVMQMIPGPLKFILFLFLIVFLGFIISGTMQIFGIYCNSANEPVKVGGLFTGITLITEVPDPELLGLEAIQMEEYDFTQITKEVTKCSRTYQNPHIYQDGELIEIINEPRAFYDGGLCTECEIVKVCPPATLAGDCYDRCKGDVYKKEPGTKNLMQRVFCGNIGCEPPEDYYYDQSEDIYACNSESCAGITIADQWDKKLQDKGATLLYQDTQGERDKKVESAIGATCSQLKPRISVFGLDILDFRILMMIVIISILVWIYRKLP